MIQLLYYHMKMLVINKSMTVEHFDKLNFMKYNKKNLNFVPPCKKNSTNANHFSVKFYARVN